MNLILGTALRFLLQRHRLSVALSGFCLVMAGVAEAKPNPPRVIVRLLLLNAPSSVQNTMDLNLLGPMVGHQSQLTPGTAVFLEAWCQTPGPNPVTTAVIDVNYETTFFDTTVVQTTVAPQWDFSPFAVSVDDATGHIDDIGGNNLTGFGVSPNWAKIGTVELDVTSTPSTPVDFCSLFAGGHLTFAILREGAVPPNEVSYQCLTVGCSLDANCDDQNPCTIDSCDSLVGCLNLPDDALCDDGLFCNGFEFCSVSLDGCVPGVLPCLPDREVCDNAMGACLPVSVPGDTDDDDDVDLADMSIIFNCFGKATEPGRSCDIAELNGDLKVDLLDVAVAISNLLGP